MKHSIQILLASSLLFGGGTFLRADTFYWGSPTPDETAANTSMQDNTHWFMDAAGSTGATAFPSSNSDHAIFSINALNTATVLNPRAFANVTVNSLTFNNNAGLVINGGGGNRELRIGSGGVTLNSGASSGVTLGDATANRNILVRFVESQTWTNNSSSSVTIRNNAAVSSTATAPVVLTLNAAGSGGISNSGNYSDGAGGNTLAIVVASTGTGSVGFQNSTYSGGTTIRSGLASISTNSTADFFLGTQTVRLGHTTGNANATLRIGTQGSFATNLQVQAGNNGTQTIEFTHANGGGFGGTIALDHDLNVGVRTAQTATLNNVISGNGNLIKGQYQGGASGILTLTADNTYSGNTQVTNGTLILADDASLSFYLGANGVNNRVTGTAATIFNGDFVFDLAGASLVDGNSWQIIDVGTLTETFGTTFTVAGFTESSGVWTMGGFSFSETTGLMSYATVPEPSALAFVGCGLLGMMFLRRRRRDSL